MERQAGWVTAVLPAKAPDALAEALSWLRRGEPVAFPTDTVYGVGVAANDLAALERLYRVKERPRHLGLPLLLAEAEDMAGVCPSVPESAWLLAERFWPGGLTLVLPCRPEVPDLVTGGRASVAVRLPAHPVPRELARLSGGPLAASSANVSGQPAPATARAVLAQLSGRIPLLLDGGTCAGGQASTIVDLSQSSPRLLRLGPVSQTELEEVLGPLAEPGLPWKSRRKR